MHILEKKLVIYDLTFLNCIQVKNKSTNDFISIDCFCSGRDSLHACSYLFICFLAKFVSKSSSLP